MFSEIQHFKIFFLLSLSKIKFNIFINIVSIISKSHLHKHVSIYTSIFQSMLYLYCSNIRNIGCYFLTCFSVLLKLYNNNKKKPLVFDEKMLHQGNLLNSKTCLFYYFSFSPHFKQAASFVIPCLQHFC